jgi:glutathione S-transferase
MKLYYSPGVCSLSPHIVAREAGIDLELIKVDLKTHKTEDGRDFYTVNSRGYVPVLELDDGTRVREGAAIVQFLADKVPASELAAPAGTIDRLRLQEWLTFIGTELHKRFTPLFNGMAKEIQDEYREGIKRGLRELDDRLASSPYLTGEKFTAADAYAFTIVNWCNFVNIDIRPLTHLSAFMTRVGTRPKVQEALKAEGLTTH